MTKIITYNEMKNSYKNFKNNLPEDEFDRWYGEYNFLNALIKFAKKQNLDKDTIEYTKLKEETAQKLRDMGYKIDER